MKVACSKILLVISAGLLSTGTAIAQSQPKNSPQPSIPASPPSIQQDTLKVLVRDEVDRLKKDTQDKSELYIRNKVNETMLSYTSLFALLFGGTAGLVLAARWKTQFKKESLEAIKQEVSKHIETGVRGEFNQCLQEIQIHLGIAREKRYEIESTAQKILEDFYITQQKNTLHFSPVTDVTNLKYFFSQQNTLHLDSVEQKTNSGIRDEVYLQILRQKVDSILSEKLRLSLEPGRTSSPEFQSALRELKEEFRLMSDKNIWDASDYVMEGDVFYYANNYDAAIDAYDKAFTMDFHNSRIWYGKCDAFRGKGDSLRILGKLEEAISAYEKAIEINPDYFLACTNLAMAVWRKEGYDKAIICVERAIVMNPDYFRPWYNKACYLARLNRVNLSIESLEHAIKLEDSCRKLAKIDADFDAIRGNEQFLKLLED
jgi:TPR repeat/Tetratricopeptide repeat